MCGEHTLVVMASLAGVGSSPHVRGTPDLRLVRVHALGIIPACAGNTRRHLISPAASRDHPRMCGEHFRIPSFSPAPAGSSPHVRGTRRQGSGRDRTHGIIPACAGNTPVGWHHGWHAWDHPRMCGEHRHAGVGSMGSVGSSPHVRGTLDHCKSLLLVVGIIPACAGNTLRK